MNYQYHVTDTVTASVGRSINFHFLENNSIKEIIIYNNKRNVSVTSPLSKFYHFMTILKLMINSPLSNSDV